MINIKDKLNNNLFQVSHHTWSIDTIPESGCTAHYIQPNKDLHSQESVEPIFIELPDGGVLSSNKVTSLPIPEFSKKYQQAHIFPDITTGNLLSIAQLCDDDCDVLFNKKWI